MDIVTRAHRQDRAAGKHQRSVDTQAEILDSFGTVTGIAVIRTAQFNLSNIGENQFFVITN